MHLAFSSVSAQMRLPVRILLSTLRELPNAALHADPSANSVKPAHATNVAHFVEAFPANNRFPDFIHIELGNVRVEAVSRT